MAGWQGRNGWYKKLGCFGKGSRNRYMRLDGCLRRFTVMPGALVLNPDDGIISVVARIVHHSFHDHVRRDSKGKQQCGKRTANPIGAEMEHDS